MQPTDKIINIVLDNKERIKRIENNMITRDEYLHSHDQMMTILRRLDDERVSMIEWLKRHDRQLERLGQQ